MEAELLGVEWANRLRRNLDIDLHPWDPVRLAGKRSCSHTRALTSTHSVHTLPYSSKNQQDGPFHPFVHKIQPTTLLHC
jgi:hypothetical protein